jgi:hypothetical protein
MDFFAGYFLSKELPNICFAEGVSTESSAANGAFFRAPDGRHVEYPGEVQVASVLCGYKPDSRA